MPVDEGIAGDMYNVLMEIRLLGHSAYRTEYHMVWVFKYQRRILNPSLRGHSRKLFFKIMKSLPGCEIIEYNIQVDHIHMVMIIPPIYKVSEVVDIIKMSNCQQTKEKVFLAIQSILEREYRMVIRILCLYHRS